MSLPAVPPPLAQLGRRRFSFHPAILNVRHNEWIYQSATWSEVLVRNTKTHDEILVPRRYLGDVSRLGAPVMTVGLLKELERRAGAIVPAQRRVIEMPRAVNDSVRTPASPAPVVGIRLESRAESRFSKLAVGGVALGVVGCVLAISLYRGGLIATRAFYSPAPQGDLQLTHTDDYSAVVRALGPPARERWRSDSAGTQYQVLAYPRRGWFVILMGRDRAGARYIGAMDWSWRPVHTVDLAGSGSSYDVLRRLSR